MVLHEPRTALRLETVDDPEPGPGQLLLRVEACGVCRTDLHIVDGELDRPNLPLILGHEIVGRIVRLGDGVSGFLPGMRIGVPWLGSTCGVCPFCASGSENLCDHGRFTGYDINGGYAELTVADARYCFPLDEAVAAATQAPLLCAGLIGYRSFRLAGQSKRLGIYGFGAAAHLIAQLAIFEAVEVHALTRPGDAAAQHFARRIGCAWAGGADERPPAILDAALIFAPVGALVPVALAAVRKGGIVVCGGIHMSPIPSFDYDLLWGERVLRSVANLTRRDAAEFLAHAKRAGIRPAVETFPLDRADRALDALRQGGISGAAVLIP
jgi:propanol-preferring alcohol dehydrogenase